MSHMRCHISHRIKALYSLYMAFMILALEVEPTLRECLGGDPFERLGAMEEPHVLSFLRSLSLTAAA